MCLVDRWCWLVVWKRGWCGSAWQTERGEEVAVMECIGCKGVQPPTSSPGSVCQALPHHPTNQHQMSTKHISLRVDKALVMIFFHSTPATDITFHSTPTIDITFHSTSTTDITFHSTPATDITFHYHAYTTIF